MVEGAALGVVVVAVGAAADHQFALVRLRDVAVHGVGHHHHIEHGLYGLAHHRLERHALDRQAEAGHFGEAPRVAGHDQRKLPAADAPAGGIDGADAPAAALDPGDFALLDDVHAHIRAGAGIAPGHRIVARGAAAGLPERAEHGVAGAFEIDHRHQLLDARGADEFGFHPLKRIGLGGAQIAALFVLRLGQHHHAAGREHDVQVEIPAHGFIKRAGLLVDRGGRILEVVRADDGGVAPGVAAPQPALFQHRHIGDAVVAAEIIGGGEPVAARAHDHHIIFTLRLGACPGARPAPVKAQALAQDCQGVVAFHPGSPCPFLAPLIHPRAPLPRYQAAESG